ncbi:MAG: SOS response-associated peptidase [Actinobacteria bacterium]|nr:SOS response-associated peptidase [Actinomycetota bacterium]
MCGRYVSFSEADQLAQFFDVGEVSTESLDARYNVAPTQEVYAIIQRDGDRRLGTLQWGFVPFWAEDPSKSRNPINARIEGIHDKRMFSQAFERRRCIVPADGFYEWKKTDEVTAKGKPKKQPFYIHDPDGDPLAFAGIWSSWRPEGDENAEPVYSVAIITTKAKGPMAEVHDRMPLMLPGELWDRWLDPDVTDVAAVEELVKDLDAPDLELYEISTRVNNVRNEGPDLIAREGG